MNHYNCFSINQLKIMFLMDENNEREVIQSFNIKNYVFDAFFFFENKKIMLIWSSILHARHETQGVISLPHPTLLGIFFIRRFNTL